MHTYLSGIVSRLGIGSGTKIGVVSYPNLKGGGKQGDKTTIVLLHMDGTNNGTSFPDAGGNTWTPAAAAVTSTADFVFGTASMYVDGVGSYISTPNNSAFAPRNSAFTIDFRYKPNVIQTGYFMGQYVDSNNYWHINITNTRYISIEQVVGGSYKYQYYINSGSPVGDAWAHYALVRTANGGITLYVNGTSWAWSGVGASSVGVDITNINAPLVVGGRGNGTCTKAWIDEVRYSIGVARWTANFTPPTAPY